MIPILYSTISEGTVPSHYGVGALTDAISVTVEESRNSSYELAMTYPVNGIHASDIVPNAFIKAKPNYTDNPQLFRIYKIGKAINGIFEINAQHISYDLSGKTISSGTAINIVSACALLEASAGSFEIQTSKNTVGNFVISEPSSVRSWFGGKEGSLLDVYGGGEWKYDNYNCKLWEHRGADRGVTIRYGKNLTELNQTIDASNLYTDVLCFYKGDGGVVLGEKVSTGLSLDVEKVLTLDVTSEFQSVPEQQDLTDKATAYVGTHNLTVPLNNITLDFVQNGSLSDRVDLCDIVTVYFEALGISAKFKCIRTKWDVLTERYTETEFGDVRTNITDTIGENASAISTANSNASEAINLVNGKAKVFVSTPVPPYNVGDIWTDSNDIYYCTTPRTETVTGSGSGSIVEFDTLIGGALTGCEIDIEGSQSGTGTPSPLNPRPLIAFTEANISRTGKNLVFKTLSDANIGGTGTIATAVGFSDLQVARVVEGETYALKTDAGQFIGGFFTSEPSIGSTTYDGARIVQNAQTFTAPITGFVVFRTTNGYASPQLELGSTSTTFEPYEGEVYTVDFGTGGTVYKGSLDVLTGELTVTHKVVDLGDLSWNKASTAPYFFGNGLPDPKIVPNGSVAPFICEQYDPKSANDIVLHYNDYDGSIGLRNDGVVLVNDLGKQTLTNEQFKTAMTGIKLAYELATPETYNLTPSEVMTVIGHNVVFADTGDISVSYFVDGFTMQDWSLASNYVSNSDLEEAISNASEIITGTKGGYVVLHDSDNDGSPDEILIMNTNDINTATQVWRWNKGGLGYATEYNSLNYALALTGDGQIVADRITTGSLDASRVTIQHLTASMFEGSKITLGGLNNTSGVFELKNENDIVIGEMDKDGLKFYGAGPEGQRPYVLLNNQVGFAGYDANDNPLFWVNRDEFTMEKCVARKEISACNKIRFIPITLKDENDQIINDGVAIVALIDSGA